VPTVHRFRAELAMTLMVAGNLARNLKDHNQAVALQERAVVLGEALARDNPDMVSYQFDLANSLMNLGLTLVEADRPGDSLPFHARASGVYETILRKNPANIGAASFLAGSQNNSAMALAKLGRHEEAIKVLGEAIEHQRACMERDPKTDQRVAYKQTPCPRASSSVRRNSPTSRSPFELCVEIEISDTLGPSRRIVRSKLPSDCLQGSWAMRRAFFSERRYLSLAEFPS
jgi:tetratricopeptide (TPR) repeat protein